MKKLILGLGLGALSSSAFCAVDIATAITTFTGTAEDYVEAALPAVFVIVGLYFLVKVIKRFTK